VQGAPAGPMLLEQLLQMIRAGQIARTTLVWKQGTPAWMAAETFPELAQGFQATPPTVPDSARIKQFLVGTWQATSQMYKNAGTQQITVRFMPDGTYSGVVVTTMTVMPEPYTTAVSGRWDAVALAQDRFSLTLTDDATQQPTSSANRIIDPNTVENEATRVRSIRTQ
jgi:hypothetical protein